MNILVLDVENSVQRTREIDEETGKIIVDNSPFNPLNRLVNVHWRKIENGIIGDDNHSIYYHNEYAVPDSPDSLQDALDWADIIVGHNIKYDILWLTESGFKVPDKAYDTMIGEYILARGVRMPLSLEMSAIRRNVTHKKADIIEEYWNDGVGFEAMPIPILLEYTDADVLSCAELYLVQQKLFQEKENLTLNNIVELMNENLQFLVEIERNGVSIDLAQLDIVEAQYREEHAKIEENLDKIVRSVMGDTPIKLTSPVDISKVVYSREVTNRDEHVKIFGISDDWPPYMTDAAFAAAVRKTTRVIRKTQAKHCIECDGRGWIQKVKKNGDPHKRTNLCKVCKGRGFILVVLKPIAGLRLNPEIPLDASAHGFSVSKLQIDRLLAQAHAKGNLDAIAFLEGKKRLNAINVYLNSFVMGIRRWTRADNLLHPNFNQHVARTGRLSSTNPNFQNQPKGKKFPVRDCIVSRFEGGSIQECDFSGLEFRVAGDLSRDPQIIKDVLDGKDIHRQTASIVHQRDGTTITKDERNEVKPHTFAPLYGAQGKNQPEHIRKYYEEFFKIYKRHGEWQVEQMESVLATGIVRTPSGREYRFPGTKRISENKTTNSTQIVNYPVQGFATGDIVPLACVRALRKWREVKPKSLLTLTVHDSIVADVYPGEEQLVTDMLHWATTGVTDEIKTRWSYEMALPLASEQARGINWGHLEEIKHE